MRINIQIEAETQEEYRNALAILCEGIIGSTPEHPLVETPAEEAPKKRGRPPKKKKNDPPAETADNVVPIDAETSTPVPQPDPEPEPAAAGADDGPILDKMKQDCIAAMNALWENDAGRQKVRGALEHFGVQNFQDLNDDQIGPFKQALGA